MDFKNESQGFDTSYKSNSQNVSQTEFSMDIETLLSGSVQYLKSNFVKLVLIYILGLLVMMLLVIIPYFIKVHYYVPADGSLNTTGFVTILALFFLMMLGIMLSAMAVINYIIQTSRGESIGVFEAYGRVVPFFFSYLLLMILAFFFIGLGMVVFIIPGIILAIYLTFVPFVFFDEGFRGMGAIKRSYEYAKGEGLSIFSRISIVTIATFFITLILEAITRHLGVIGNILYIFFSVINGLYIYIFMFQLYRAVKFKKTGTF